MPRTGNGAGPITGSVGATALEMWQRRRDAARPEMTTP